MANLVIYILSNRNQGEQEFVIEHLDASFRYPMDWTYHIQVCRYYNSTFGIGIMTQYIPCNKLLSPWFLL